MSLEPNFIFNYELGEDSLEFPFFVYLSGDYICFFSLADEDIIGAVEKRILQPCNPPLYLEKKSIYRHPSHRDDIKKVILSLELGALKKEILEFILNPQVKAYSFSGSLKKSIISFLSSIK